MLRLILVILLVILLVAAVPTWPHSAGWGYSPAGVLATVVLVLLLLWQFDVIEFNDVDDDDGTTPNGLEVEVEQNP